MHTLLPLLLRLGAVVAGICVIAVLFRIVGQALGVLPPALQGFLGAGWHGVFTTVAPAFPALAALVIVIAAIWLILSGRR